MDLKELKPNIKQLSTLLLNDNLQFIDTKNIIDSIQEYFYEITNISPNSTEMEHLAAVPTANGVALGLSHAAQCLLDYNRTVLFLKGVVLAIKEKQKEHPNETIKIFYAGCGPYAPFITLIAPMFQENEIQFSLLEINKKSLDSAKKLISELELDAFVKDYHLADAVTFEIPNPDSFHILFSETLDSLLFRECYVPILWNLLPQLKEDIVLIPKTVCLKLSFLTQKTISEKPELEETYAGIIFDTWNTLKENTSKKLPELFPTKYFEPNSSHNYDGIVIDTEVNVYDSLWLLRGTSSLTLPYQMEIKNPPDFKKMAFTYYTQPTIELKCNFE